MQKRALGIDFGDARIGLALSDEMGFMAHPLRTVHVREEDPLEAVAVACKEKNVEWIIVGLPRNMDGSEGEAAKKARDFAKALDAKVSCRILLWDERMTTLAAQRALHESGRDARKSRGVIDQVAAQMILQGWMDSGAMG